MFLHLIPKDKHYICFDFISYLLDCPSSAALLCTPKLQPERLEAQSFRPLAQQPRPEPCAYLAVSVTSATFYLELGVTW